MPKHQFSSLIGRTDREGKTFMRMLDGKAVTYEDLREGSARYANALRLLGVKVGDRVAVQVEKSVDAVLLYAACLRAGIVYLPLNVAYTMAELDYFIEDAEPALVVCRPQSIGAMRTLCAKRSVAACESLDDLGGGSLAELAASQDVRFSDALCEEQDLAAILYTSGTTGRSKGAMLSYGNLASNAKVLSQYWGFREADILIHALPIFHTHGLFVAINVTLFAGSSMIFMPKFELDLILAALPEATVLMGVPTFYARLLQSSALDRERCAGMRLFVSGSAPLLADTHKQWQARTGHAILERYGMTETNMISSNPLEGERIAGSVGFPLPGVELRIADPATGKPLPQGEIGVIEVRGPNVFKGYWRNPEKTAMEFRDDGFFITGDLGTIDKKGYVQIVGRGKDLIITGGYNVYPKEIETEIDNLEGIFESAVVGVPHSDFGEGIVAAVVMQPGHAVTEAAILTKLKTTLAGYKIPKRVFFVPELPRNTMGKVRKETLRNDFSEVFSV
ncbi:malonyl-CoA synthase [Mesorhizobium sp. YM1C-6-2]|uniref:malonate--CoA ligase n=1 Tax=Mesorhizobium sp. YM1C-6-2 TaxID=1827501 RepID=UPI000EF1AA09|nr:malonyl-CoA synthase [Mesorhizobium sp. YM1C-6-2]RLP28416.1 malonyl-CoA synthase [Mesorhizobium sp. YM1C-6-2]